VERLLGVLAAVIAVALFATAAQRRIVIWFVEHLTEEEKAQMSEYLSFDYPSELVLVYGLVFKLVLALGVVPSLSTLQNVG
jgi:hypothetical protein